MVMGVGVWVVPITIMKCVLQYMYPKSLLTGSTAYTEFTAWIYGMTGALYTSSECSGGYTTDKVAVSGFLTMQSETGLT